MASFETRLARIEVLSAPVIPLNVRDPELVELIRIFDKELPLEQIPCGVSGRELFNLLVKKAEGTSLPIIK